VDALNATQHDGTDDDPSNANLAANANSDARNGTILGWYSKLSRLAKDFVYVAKEYGKIIIMERDLVRKSIVQSIRHPNPTDFDPHVKCSQLIKRRLSRSTWVALQADISTSTQGSCSNFPLIDLVCMEVTSWQ
jgi:hypothetical protein